MIDPDGFFIKLYPTVWGDMEGMINNDDAARELGIPLTDLKELDAFELGGRLAAVRTLRIVESALSQVKKIREDRDRDFQRNHR